jgi:hypothetical protein
MLKTVDDIKNLVLWAKGEKIKNIQIGEIIFQFHDDAFKTMTFDKPAAKTAEEIAKEEEAILFHSAN